MVEVKNLTKKLGRFELSNISFSLKAGSYLVLLGESGAGKTLLLELLAGIQHPDSGSVILDGEELTKRSIQHRGFGIVFQDLALFPHLTVGQNIRFPLKMRGFDKETAQDECLRISRQMEIEGLLSRMPHTLSGGQKQRVALARNLVIQPKCLLLDEPLTALDSRLKHEMRFLLKRIHESGQTIIHVTHAYEEALFLSTHIGIIQGGKMNRFGLKEDVLKDSGDPWISDYIRNFNIKPF